jgi:acyl dehydratase
MDEASKCKVDVGHVRRNEYVVTKRDIKRFAQAIGDDNPLYYDEAFAKQTQFGSIVAPPLFCQSFTFEDVSIQELPADLSPIELNVDVPASKTVGGSSRYRFYQYVRPGDTISVVSEVKSIKEKKGKSGVLYLVEIETCFTNQFGERVAKELATYVKR